MAPWARHNVGMPNIATLLKSEIARVARKEVRAETQSLKKSTGGYRSEIAALKRRTQTLEQLVRRLSKAGAGAGAAREDAAAGEGVQRFSAKGLASQRRRLGLSARDCGLLLGVSAQTIYNWEDGQGRPRARNMPAIAALRSMGKKESNARLETLRGAG